MKYKKKPVTIEARQLTAKTRDDVCRWVNEGKRSPQAWFYDSNGADEIYIETLEGTMVATDGDFIIQGVKGEFYPCKPDIFAATYEPVSTETPTPKDQAIESLRTHANNPDQEEAHHAADMVLCKLLTDLGYADVVNEWHKIEKWYA